MPHSELFQLFARYWWLLFPLCWGLGRLARLWSRHVQAQKSLDVIKSYVDQGKEPPAALLQALQSPAPQDSYAPPRDYSRRSRGWIPVFLFTGLATAFTFMASRDSWDEGHIFIAIIMGALALGFAAAILSGRRDDRTPPL